MIFVLLPSSGNYLEQTQVENVVRELLLIADSGMRNGVTGGVDITVKQVVTLRRIDHVQQRPVAACISGSQLGVVRLSAAWTCRAGWGRLKPQGFPRATGFRRQGEAEAALAEVEGR